MSESTRLREGRGYAIFYVLNLLFLALVLVVTAYPIYHVLIASFSNPSAMAANYGLMLTPFSLLTTKAYQLVFRYPLVLSGYANTLVIVTVGLVVNLTLTSLGAYYLTLKDSLFRKPMAVLVVFSIYFSGGMVPMYLNVKNLGLYDSTWALIIPVAISTYNMLILRSAFASIPASMTEAALPGALVALQDPHPHLRAPDRGDDGGHRALLRRRPLERLVQRDALHHDSGQVSAATRAASDHDPERQRRHDHDGHRRGSIHCGADEVRADRRLLRTDPASVPVTAALLREGDHDRRSEGLIAAPWRP